jgi:hypothetical protein
MFGSASRERDCKRSLEQAGGRLVAVDDSYVEVVLSDLAQPRGRILRVVRRRYDGQLSLAVAPALAAA